MLEALHPFSLLGAYNNVTLNSLSTYFIEKIESNVGDYSWNLDSVGSRSAHNNCF